MNFEELMSKYIDGEELKDAELIFIHQKLVDEPSLIEFFKGHVKIETLLSTPLTWEKQIFLIVKSKLQRPIIKSETRKVQKTKGAFFILKWGWAIAASLLLVLFLPFLWQNTDNSLVLSVKSSKSDIIINDKLYKENLFKGAKIKTPSKIITPKGGNLLIEYSDKTRLELGEDSEINTIFRENSRKIIFLKNGFLKVDSTPQKKSMLISTPNTDIEVIGTSFEIRSSEEKTCVDLIKGRLSVTNNVSGEKVVLNKGESIISYSSGNITKTEDNDSLLWKAENGGIVSFREENGDNIITLSTGEKDLKDAKIVRHINFITEKEIKINFQVKAIGLESCGSILIFKNAKFENVHLRNILEYTSPPPRDWTKVEKIITVPENMVSALCVVYINGNGELQLKNFKISFSE
ncbi:MAG TPA: FecR family protein [Victivallales bacterium]|nr:FecR family protein [Victivallales bacterium]HPO90312.1 FecR family protein [Victivallales bacterium]HRR27801.1 FecR family protein [Victivallales bacterium]HRU00240.1 FecR family protein [Victivallales bacterium]